VENDERKPSREELLGNLRFHLIRRTQFVGAYKIDATESAENMIELIDILLRVDDAK